MADVGNDIVAIYAVGSITRNEFLLHLSDINFVIVHKK